MAPLSSRRHAMLACVVLLITQAGCLPVVRQAVRARVADLDPSGAPASEVLVRQLLVAGAAEVAADALATRARPASLPAPWQGRRLEPSGDPLLDALVGSATAFYAGRYATSVEHVDAAERLAEQRITRSLTREATAWLTNDAGREYRPSRVELGMLPYYGVLAYLSRGDLSGATVEARRLAQRLEETEGTEQADDRSLRAAQRALTAAVFAAAGEWNDAAVARRHVAALTGDSVTWSEVAPAAPASTSDSVDVLLVVEEGFVPHRVAQLAVLGGGRRRTTDDGLMTWLTGVHSRDPFGGVHGVGRWSRGSWWLDERDDHEELGARRRDRLTLAWPVLAPMPRTAWGRPHVQLGEAAVPLVVGDVATSVAAEYRRALPGLLARVASRAIARQAALSAVDGAKGKARTAATVLGLAMAAMDAADTRSWSLLPARVAVRSVRVPAGTAQLVVALDGVTHRVPVLGGAPTLRLAHLRRFGGAEGLTLPWTMAQTFAAR